MEATLSTNDYIERLLGMDKKVYVLHEQEHMDKVFSVKQDLSFLAKVIPAFVYRHYSKFGLEEMQDLLYNRLLKMSEKDLLELAFSMYGCVKDPENSRKTDEFTSLEHIAMNDSICDKINLKRPKPITEGMLYKLIESPVYLLLQNDLSKMTEYLKRGSTINYDNINEVDSDGSSPASITMIRQQMMANTKQLSIPMRQPNKVMTGTKVVKKRSQDIEIEVISSVGNSFTNSIVS